MPGALWRQTQRSAVRQLYTLPGGADEAMLSLVLFVEILR
jgi:hypothetical protein